MDKIEVDIYQIYYKDEQLSCLDSEAIPYDNRNVRNPLLEFGVFLEILQERRYFDGFWGAVSWKFKEKTGLTLESLKKYIANHPGIDCFYCNPFPETEAFYPNLWQQGAVCHPDFDRLAEVFFKAAELDTRSLTAIQSSKLFSTTNYHIGNARFWRSYTSFVTNCLALACKNLSKADLDALSSTRADAKGAHAGASYLPFIVERLFSYWLYHVAVKEGITTNKYPVSPTTLEDGHVSILRSLKERATAEKSNLLTVSWSGYRNVYLTQRYGVQWAKEYLPKIASTNIHIENLDDTRT